MKPDLITLDNALDYAGLPISAASRSNGIVYTAGIVAIDPVNGHVVEGEIEVQARVALSNLQLVLEQAGSSMDQILLVQVFLADIESDMSRFNEVYSDVFSAHCPPRFAVGAHLAWPTLRVELQATALCATQAQEAK